MKVEMETEMTSFPKKKVWAVAVFSILLTGCDCCDNCPGSTEHVFVADGNGLEVAQPNDAAAQKLALTFSPSSMMFWRQSGSGLGVEAGDCSVLGSADDFTCSRLFYTSGTALTAVAEPTITSTPQPVTITTSHPVGSVAFSGAPGGLLYVTYPNDASVGRILGYSEAELLPAISLHGTKPLMLAITANSNPLHFMLSGNSSSGVSLVSFTDIGDSGTVKTAAIGSNNGIGVNSFGANARFVAVVNIDLLVYDKDLNFLGKVAILGKKVGTITLVAANRVVVDQGTNMAYVSSFSDPTSKGVIVAVDLSAMSIVGQVATVGVLPATMVLSPDGDHLYVANYGDTPGTVTVLNAGPGGVTFGTTIAVGKNPGVMALRPPG